MPDLFDNAEITAADKVACAEREVRQRRRVYPRLIASGRMLPATASREIAVMEAIAADYRAIAGGTK